MRANGRMQFRPKAERAGFDFANEREREQRMESTNKRARRKHGLAAPEAFLMAHRGSPINASSAPVGTKRLGGGEEAGSLQTNRRREPGEPAGLAASSKPRSISNSIAVQSEKGPSPRLERPTATTAASLVVVIHTGNSV